MGIFDNLFDKEGAVRATIEQCLENVAQELDCNPTEMFIMIKPIRDEFVEDSEIPEGEHNHHFKCWVYVAKTGKRVREIPLKEILGD